MKPKPRIFLSYADADRAFAAKLANGLAKAGINASDLTRPQDGKTRFEAFRKELVASDLVVFVVPSRQGEGRWALAEVGAARALDKQILAVVPDRARNDNSAFARALTESALVDAAKLSASALIDKIVSHMPAH